MITISVFPQTFTKIIVIRTEWSLHVKRLSPPSCTRLAPTEGSPTSTPTSAWPPPAWSRTRGSSRRSPGWLMIWSKLLKTRDLQGRGGDLPQRLWLSHSSPTPCPASERLHARLHPLFIYQVKFDQGANDCDSLTCTLSIFYPLLCLQTVWSNSNAWQLVQGGRSSALLH